MRGNRLLGLIFSSFSACFALAIAGCANGSPTANGDGTGDDSGTGAGVGPGGGGGNVPGADAASPTPGTGSGADAGGDGSPSTPTPDSGGGGPIVPGDAAGVDAADAGPQLGAGQPCQSDGDCASNLCKPVLLGSSVCVVPCTKQSDCSTVAGSFCEPITAGSANGYCIPRSPAHCLSCTKDGDCGALSESCTIGPNDNALACHVDCSLAGKDACPSDYTCASATVNGAPRMLCLPDVGTCLDAVGGFCDRIGVPQACRRANGAGQCIGHRICDSITSRYGSCDAQAPQCKGDCSIQDPAGCTESYCAGATTQVTNCGGCGVVCPGYQKPYDTVACVAGSPPTCSFACYGENYDVNTSTADGCESQDAPFGNHDQAHPWGLGSFPCDDSGSQQNVDGKIPSDARVHDVPVLAFNGTTGAAPDWFSLYGSGGSFCQNDANLALQVNGSQWPSCYQMVLSTNKVNESCQTNGSGACSISNGSGSYGDGTTLYVVVQKTCSAAQVEAVTYKITGHL